MVSSTVGSSTITGWKRRSRAASFSIYWRYSSRVVAPIQCNSPLASIGLSKLPASIAPSVLPAPTIVWISSMKRIISPLEFFTSLRTAFNLSSNSPLYLAPATRAPISRANTFLSFNASGTSPFTILWARPSTTAVLPTPGSPIRTGLFFVFLERILITFLISLSLPITGSSLPSLALSTRSWPYFLSTSYLASGLSESTTWLPLTSDNAFKNVSLVMLYFLKREAMLSFGALIIASIKCSTDTYESPIAFDSSSASLNTLLSGLLTLSWTFEPETLGFELSILSISALISSFEIPIFSKRFAIKLSSIVKRLYRKCSWSISWLP